MAQIAIASGSANTMATTINTMSQNPSDSSSSVCFTVEVVVVLGLDVVLLELLELELPVR